MGCKQSEYIAVNETFVTTGGSLKVLSVYVGDPMNVNTVSFDLLFTAPNGETINIPGAGMGFEATFTAIDTVIRVWDLSFYSVKLEMCSPLINDDPAVTGKELVFPFSKEIALTPKIIEYINKIVRILGGKSAYIEGGNKIVVVL